jgi:hypothetical protein
MGKALLQARSERENGGNLHEKSKLHPPIFAQGLVF